MDNIITVTTALKKRRNKPSRFKNRLYYSKRGQKKICRLADMYWVNPATVKLYVFQRVTGTIEPKLNPNVEIKLYLMPCFMVSGVPELHPIFQESFVLYAKFQEMEVYDAKWVSIDATASQYPGQYITAQAPLEYHPRIGEILSKVAFPVNITEKSRDGNTPSFDSVSKLRFYRFHLFYLPGRNYGVIDRMWNQYGSELELSLPPELDFSVKEGDPKDNPWTTIQRPKSRKPKVTAPQASFPLSTPITPSLENDFNTFLNSTRSNVFPSLKR